MAQPRFAIFIFVLVGLLLPLAVTNSGCGSASTPAPVELGTSLTGEVKCRREFEIYENTSSAPINVTVEATDKCGGFPSHLKAGDREEDIPDGTTATFTFSVPPEGKIFFACSGVDQKQARVGQCSYTISVP